VFKAESAKSGVRQTPLNKTTCFLERACRRWLLRTALPRLDRSEWPHFLVAKGQREELLYIDKSLTSLPVAAVPSSADYPKDLKTFYSKRSTQTTLLNTTKSQHDHLMQASNKPLSSARLVLGAPASSRRVEGAKENHVHPSNHAQSPLSLSLSLPRSLSLSLSLLRTARL